MGNQWHCNKGDLFWYFEAEGDLWEAKYASSGSENWFFQMQHNSEDIGSFDYDATARHWINFPQGMPEIVKQNLKQRLKKERLQNPLFIPLSANKKEVLGVLYQALMENDWPSSDWIPVRDIKRVVSRKLNLTLAEVGNLIESLSPRCIETRGEYCCITLIGLWTLNRIKTEMLMRGFDKALKKVWREDEHKTDFDRRSISYELFHECLQEQEDPHLRKAMYVFLITLFPGFKEKHWVDDPEYWILDDDTYVNIDSFVEYLQKDSRHCLFSYLEESDSSLASPYSLSKILRETSVDFPEPVVQKIKIPANQSPSSMKYKAGQSIGRWILQSYVGGGGQSEVWEVSDGSPKPRSLVMKICDLSSHPSALVRIKNEVDILRKNLHENVITITDDNMSQTQETQIGYYVMPKMEYSLKTFIDAFCSDSTHITGYLTFQNCLRMMIDICDAVSALHNAGYIHRDIKEDNILLSLSTDKLIIKLADPGIVLNMNDENRVTQKGERVGNFSHMPPEVQFGNKGWNEQGEIYSLGSLFKWLMEKVAGKFIMSIESDGLLEDIRKLSTIIDKSMHHDPAQRHHSVDELMEELKALEYVS